MCTCYSCSWFQMKKVCTGVLKAASVTRDTRSLRFGVRSSTAKQRGIRELLYVPGLFLQRSLGLSAG